jgi:hypothetical protein
MGYTVNVFGARCPKNCFLGGRKQKQGENYEKPWPTMIGILSVISAKSNRGPAAPSMILFPFLPKLR